MVISQVPAVSCIQVPTFETVEAIQRSRKRAMRRGAKPSAEGGLINGGFFILEPNVLQLIDGHDTVWEKDPMEALAADGQLAAWVHRGFWQPMDTLRDKELLNSLWESGAAPWKLWEG